MTAKTYYSCEVTDDITGDEYGTMRIDAETEEEAIAGALERLGGSADEWLISATERFELVA